MPAEDETRTDILLADDASNDASLSEASHSEDDDPYEKKTWRQMDNILDSAKKQQVAHFVDAISEEVKKLQVSRSGKVISEMPQVENFIKPNFVNVASKEVAQNPASLESQPERELHEGFLKRCVDILLNEAVFDGTDRRNKVVEWHPPEELRQLLDFELRTAPASHEELEGLVQKVVR